jgi:hypothetical protein
MVKSFTYCGFLLALAALLAMTTGCQMQARKRAEVKMQVGARAITGSLDGDAFITSDGEAATIQFGSHKLLIEKERVLLDGKEEAKLPAAASKVEVDYAAGTLTVTADGARVLRLNVPK